MPRTIYNDTTTDGTTGEVLMQRVITRTEQYKTKNSL